MSKQRYIQDSFWTDSYIEKLTPDEKLLFLYLLTNPLCNIAGVYEIRPKRIGFETGFDVEVVETILGRLENDGKIVRIEDWIWIVNHTKHQASNPAVEKGILRVYGDLPEHVQTIIQGKITKKVPKYKSNLKNSKKNKIKERDGNKCVLCSSTTELHVDHIKPVFMGGDDSDENLRTLCKSCNLSRNNTDYDIYSTGFDSLSKDSESCVKLSEVKLSNINNKEKKKTKTIPRESYGEFGKVKLSSKEHTKLIERFGEVNTNILITKVDTYCAQFGREYKDYYAACLKFAQNELTKLVEKQNNVRQIV